jgi:hypothetical protein
MLQTFFCTAHFHHTCLPACMPAFLPEQTCLHIMLRFARNCTCKVVVVFIISKTPNRKKKGTREKRRVLRTME